MVPCGLNVLHPTIEKFSPLHCGCTHAWLQTFPMQQLPSGFIFAAFTRCQLCKKLSRQSYAASLGPDGRSMVFFGNQCGQKRVFLRSLLYSGSFSFTLPLRMWVGGFRCCVSSAPCCPSSSQCNTWRIWPWQECILLSFFFRVLTM